MVDLRQNLMAAGLAVFDREGFEGETLAAIRLKAGVSNGSFFHLFSSKRKLAGALFLDILHRYHVAVLAAVGREVGAEDGIAGLIDAHLAWVTGCWSRTTKPRPEPRPGLVSSGRPDLPRGG